MRNIHIPNSNYYNQKNVSVKMFKSNYQLEIFVRKRLGQRRFPRKASNKKPSHNRIDFDARGFYEYNKSIMELFEDFYKGYKCVLQTVKGGVYVQVVTTEDYNKYKYYDTDETKIDYMGNKYPNVLNLDYCCKGTVEIIVDLLRKIDKL